MKFIHTSDWHVGASWRLLPQEHLSRQKFMIDEIYRIALKYKAKVVTVSGDILHRKDPERKSRNMVLKQILKYDKLIPTIIVEGNHDSVDAEESNIHNLKILYDQRKFKQTTIVELENKIIPFEDGAFIAMPIFNKTELKILAREASKRYKWVVPLLHTTTIGVSDDKGWTAREGWDMDKVPGITYYAMGHIHKMQRLTLPNAFQCGSPMQHNFGEKPPKGVLLVDTDKPTRPSFINLKKLPALHLVNDDKGEPIPLDGYVKLITNKSLLGRKLPPNVVSTGKNLDNIEILEYDCELNPLKGLTEYLANEGLSVDEQEMGAKIVQKIIEINKES